jgi:hypothetical protein
MQYNQYVASIACGFLVLKLLLIYMRKSLFQVEYIEFNYFLCKDISCIRHVTALHCELV